MKNKNTKIKKKKLDSLPKIRRRILKSWSENVRTRDGFTCTYCGVKSGTESKFNPGTKTKCDAHHILQKEIKDCPLKYEIMNGETLCSSCHKFNGEHSAHKSPIVFYDWFRKKYPDRYDFILKNSGIRVDLDNRFVLEEIEQILLKKESLNLEKLKEIERNNPRQKKEERKEERGTLFDPDSSSSSD